MWLRFLLYLEKLPGAKLRSEITLYANFQVLKALPHPHSWTWDKIDIIFWCQLFIWFLLRFLEILKKIRVLTKYLYWLAHFLNRVDIRLEVTSWCKTGIFIIFDFPPSIFILFNDFKNTVPVKCDLGFSFCGIFFRWNIFIIAC